MSVEEPKTAITAEGGSVEPTPAPAAVLASDKPAEAIETKAEETEEKPEEKPIEPIYSGALGYKAPGLKNAFRFSKKYFWFGEEPVSVQSLSQYLRGEKAEVANPTAAWSSQTGKGLLYFVKHADEKATPAGVLNLSEGTDLSKDGLANFHLKLHGHKHTFEASTLAERNGWFVAIEKAIEEAKAAKEGIVGSESYKEELNKLRKPAALTPAASTPKKSTDVTPKVAETDGAAESSVAPARAGSSSSSSSDEDKTKKSKKAASKSRSVSRGKRASIFGSFLGKKEKLEEKKEEKKEERAEKKAEKEEDKKEEEATPAVEAPSAVAPVIPAPEAVPALEEPKPEEAIAPVPFIPITDDKKVEEEKPKPTKRGSIFGNFVEKLKSPTHEKKEADLVPAPVAKEPETTTETTKPEETAVAPLEPVTDGTTEPTPATEEIKPETKAATTTPAKEKQGFSFGKFLGGAKEKVKSPTTEKAPETKAEDTVKPEETPAPAITPIEPAVAEEPKEVKKEEEPATGVTSTASATPATKAKRGSIFGNLTGSVKKEKEGETSEKPSGLIGLFRNASKAGRSKKEKEAAAPPAKVDEATEPKEEKTETPAVEDKKEETLATPAATEPTTIGDVVPDAVSVGQAPEIKSTPQVASTA
ncbi:hypothetical protein K491DRAFT_374353 [Lophiostoma macrostomum CBS 122681]|uniref:Meiotic expression up-regulated protein 6 PH domain-containing protein n=1 Tax=Lophiostoma macrostomum CBS 122681 TaxID=1314788 RepID=A0A6A6T978_9PLEO|nr:hypothetical protein K491DRAFT_374353 [Lophiostoma macrostomum CBS 122681]